MPFRRRVGSDASGPYRWWLFGPAQYGKREFILFTLAESDGPAGIFGERRIMATAGIGRSGRRVQYAALPYRVRGDGRVEVRLITSRETRRWVIPKGWPMKGVTPAKAAARETYEEAGLLGTVSRKALGLYTYEKRLPNRTVPCDVMVFPLKVKRQLRNWPERSQRFGFWFAVESAAAAVQEEELKELILSFGEIMAAKYEAKRAAKLAANPEGEDEKPDLAKAGAKAKGTAKGRAKGSTKGAAELPGRRAPDAEGAGVVAADGAKAKMPPSVPTFAAGADPAAQGTGGSEASPPFSDDDAVSVSKRDTGKDGARKGGAGKVASGKGAPAQARGQKAGARSSAKAPALVDDAATDGLVQERAPEAKAKAKPAKGARSRGVTTGKSGSSGKPGPSGKPDPSGKSGPSGKSPSA